nr:MAG TPA: LYSOSOMAL ALPHA-MANNOSIDASE [Caudoviricetes sp.]DAS47648.1 MAG TPA: LYSOSOMAL ALPHA-MANNOSIDASE [Caudoviricetes sp.]
MLPHPCHHDSINGTLLACTFSIWSTRLSIWVTRAPQPNPPNPQIKGP